MTNTAIDNTKPLKAKKSRIWELDFLRGLCVLLMVWDHTMFNIAYTFGESWAAAGGSTLMGLHDFAVGYMDGGLRAIFHPVIFTMFFVICGISCSFSKNNFVRGLEALFFAFTISLVTAIFQIPITFGVLHMLGFSILIWWLINTICLKNRYATAAVCLVVGVVIVCIGNIPSVWARVPENPDLFFLSEFFGGNYGSADYFALIPNVGYMLLGAAVAPLIYPKRKSLLPMLDRINWHAPISACGRVALWVYVLHQVVIMALMGLISFLFITPGDFIFM